MRARWGLALTAALGLVLVGAAVPAAATPPPALGSGYVLDDAGVLSAADAAAAQSRLEELSAQTDVDMWVVYVDEFTDPADAAEWANQTADRNGLGPNQYLLAIAVDGRQFYLSGDSSGPVSEDQLATIEQNLVQPELAAEDWVGAVDAAADGLTEAAGGGTPGGGNAGSGDAGSGFFTILLVVVVIAGVVFLIVWLLRRRRKGAVAAGAAPAQPSLEDLERRASSALVQTDDAVKTSEEELGFARAQFGDEATVEFVAVLAAAKESLAQAFTLKQRLDDSEPDSPEQARAWNEQIIHLLDAANAQLDEKAEAFDELRKLEQNAPEALSRVQEHRQGVAASVAAAPATLARLAAVYAPDALSTVADNPAQAADRLAFADAQLDTAQQALGAGDGARAAVSIRAAEEAVDQSALLAQAIDKLAADLAQGEENARALAADITQDIAAASALPDADGRVAAASASARAALEAAQASLGEAGRRPLQALQQLDAANTQIDTVLAEKRDAAARAERARQVLGNTILQAQAKVSAAEDYVTARRGAVGAQARTRLAEAGASLVQATQLQQADPEGALQHAQRADQLAEAAIQAAQSDVGAFGAPAQGQGGAGMMGAMLGGIVLNSLLGGGGGGGGGFGAGSFGSAGRSSGGMRPGSFGGGGTRARRGGGRF